MYSVQLVTMAWYRQTEVENSNVSSYTSDFDQKMLLSPVETQLLQVTWELLFCVLIVSAICELEIMAPRIA